MMVHRVRSGSQGKHLLRLDRGGIRGVESFRGAEEVERFDVVRIASQSRFGELFRTPSQFAKLLNGAWIDFRFVVCFVSVAVKRRLEFPRFIQLLDRKSTRLNSSHG